MNYGGYGGFGGAAPGFNNAGQQQTGGALPANQQSMYGQQQQQQFAGMPHQAGFAPGPGGNPQMMQGSAHPGMMQGPGMQGMPNLAANGQSKHLPNVGCTLQGAPSVPP